MQCPPTATPGAVDVAEGLRVGGGDHAVEVDAGAVGEARELVGQRDVHVAVGGLGELGQLGGLGGAHRPDLGVEEAAIELDPAGLAGRAEPAQELGVGREIAEHAPAVDALGAEDGEELVLGAQAAVARERRARPGCGSCRPAASSRPPRWCPPAGRRRCRPAPRPAWPKSGRASASTTSGGTATTSSAPPATACGGVGGRAQAPVADDLGQRVGEPVLAGERRLRGVDEVDRGRVDVAADHLVAGAGDLGGERQADLAQRDDDRPQMATSTATVAPPRALASAASATSTVSRPSASVTTGRVGVACEQVAERLELDQQRLAAGQRVARRVALGDAAQRLGVLPVRRHVAVLVEGQVGGQRVGHQHAALAQDPGLAHLGGRQPVDHAVEADRVLEAPGGEQEVLVLAPHAVLGLGRHAARTGAPPSQRTRSRSWVARSMITPTSRTRSGNGPMRSVATRKTWPSSPACVVARSSAAPG